MAKPLWINPARITVKLAPALDLKGKLDGDWDIARRYNFHDTVKFRSIRQRFIEGLRWEQTDLFADVYRRRFEDDSEIRGASSIAELAGQYYDRIDGLFHSMRKDGFLLRDADDREIALPEFIIGRDGDVFIGNQGNHRLAIAKVAGLRKIAGNVTCRHKLSISR